MTRSCGKSRTGSSGSVFAPRRSPCSVVGSHYGTYGHMLFELWHNSCQVDICKSHGVDFLAETVPMRASYDACAWTDGTVPYAVLLNLTKRGRNGLLDSLTCKIIFFSSAIAFDQHHEFPEKKKLKYFYIFSFSIQSVYKSCNDHVSSKISAYEMSESYTPHRN